MLIFPQSWRTAHAVALSDDHGSHPDDGGFPVRPVFPSRAGVSLCADGTLTVGLNVLIVQYGTIGQAYGLCLFLIVAAFRLAVGSVDRKGLLFAALAGLLAAAGAAGTLLTAPVAPVLALWMAFQNRTGKPVGEAGRVPLRKRDSIPAGPLLVCERTAPDVFQHRSIQLDLPASGMARARFPTISGSRSPG